MKTLNMIAQVLLIIGGLNWGLVGLFDWNLVSALFGADTFLSNLVYILVGLSALWGIYMLAPLAKGSEVHHHRTATATGPTTGPVHHTTDTRNPPPPAR